MRFSDAFLDEIRNRLSITQVVGKWKVSQNRSISDRVGVVEALEREGTPGATIAALIRETLDGSD